MGINFWLAQVMAILGILCNIVAMQLNKKKHIMLFYILANWLFAVNFTLLNAYSGAIICFVAGFETFINNIFDFHHKKVPNWLIAIYIMISIGLGCWTFNKFIDVLPIMASIVYIFLINLKKESAIRKFTLMNISLWIIYDFSVKSYSAGINDFLLILSTLIGIYRYDIKKEKGENK